MLASPEAMNLTKLKRVAVTRTCLTSASDSPQAGMRSEASRHVIPARDLATSNVIPIGAAASKPRELARRQDGRLGPQTQIRE